MYNLGVVPFYSSFRTMEERGWVKVNYVENSVGNYDGR
jgi:hypothetical protein